ncbi:MAG: LpxI family protein [Rhizobiaceae bacterium]
MTTLTDGPPASGKERIVLIAGSGMLPVFVARAIAEAGQDLFVLLIDGEADASELAKFPHQTARLEDVATVVPLLRRIGASTVVLSGGVSRRPNWRRMKPSLELLRVSRHLWSALRKGDNGALSTLVRQIELAGIRVVGAHTLVPDLLASGGRIAGPDPSRGDLADITAAFRAAKAIGALDFGQAVVAIGNRIAAVEGVEGTDGLLERVASYRGKGRLADAKGGVLVKCAKPGQELRADLPTIGPATVDAAHRAGLNGIAVEAERALVLEQARVIDRAETLGLFVVGVSEADLP